MTRVLAAQYALGLLTRYEQLVWLRFVLKDDVPIPCNPSYTKGSLMLLDLQIGKKNTKPAL
jgi:hypothetical protein